MPSSAPRSSRWPWCPPPARRTSTTRCIGSPPLRTDVVAKGDITPGEDVAALYANSLDVRVRDRPKPKAGQGGLWLLHRTTVLELAGQAPYELLDALDLQDSILLDVLREHAI